MTTLARSPARSSPTQEALAANVITSRARAGLSQTALADLANVSRATISNIERGESAPTLDVIERIATALSIQVAELFILDSGCDVASDEVISERSTNRAGAVDARSLIAAVEEAGGRDATRYSKAGRPRVAR